MTKGKRMPKELKQRMIRTLVKVFSKKAKPINQYTKDGTWITTWNSLMEIERIIGQRRSHIRDACLSRRKTAYGYKWKYCIDYGN